MRGSDHDHLNALDGMRGIAALAVMIGHAAFILRDSVDPHGAYRMILTFASRMGHPAVILFFALSGFVLYLAWARTPNTSYGTYIIRRVCRIYPALIVAIAIATTLLLTQQPTAEPGLGRWVHRNWAFEPTAEMVVRNLLLLSQRSADNRIDPVIWSLAIEVRFSIIFPLLAIACRMNRVSMLVIGGLAYVVATVLANHLGLRHPLISGRGWMGNNAVFLNYLPAFCFGIFAADFYRHFREGLKMSGRTQIALAVALLAVGKILDDDFDWSLMTAGLIVVAAMRGPVSSLLRRPACLFLGRISYSLYLVHFPVLMVFAYAANPEISLVAAMLAASLVALALATVMYHYVEVPGIAVGKRIVAWTGADRKPAAAYGGGEPTGTGSPR